MWAPKYRKRILQGKLKERIAGMIRFCAQINEFEIIEMNLQPDHVHLLLSAKPRFSPARIMHLIKGGTSKKIRELFPELEEIYWGDSFWQDGYFVSTHGSTSLEQIKRYVKVQGQDTQAF